MRGKKPKRRRIPPKAAQQESSRAINRAFRAVEAKKKRDKMEKKTARERARIAEKNPKLAESEIWVMVERGKFLQKVDPITGKLLAGTKKKNPMWFEGDMPIPKYVSGKLPKQKRPRQQA